MSEAKTGYRVLLRKTATGEERWVDFAPSWDDSSHFLWTEGNYGCDCNRHLHFEWAGDRKDVDEDTKCGFDLYEAICAELPDGTRYGLDGEDEPPRTEEPGMSPTITFFAVYGPLQ